MRWFIVGAAATAGAFIAAGKLRSRLAADDELDLEQWDEPAPPVVPSPPRPATAFASYDTVPPADDDTQELRLRIDETRDRIRRRTQEQDAAADTDPVDLDD